MNIILATDSNFVIHCGTTMMSIVTNNAPCDFYIITEGITENETDALNRIASVNGSNMHVVLVDKNMFKDFPMPNNKGTKHISIATYYRLFIPELLPISVEKAIYLDCDIIIRKSLEELWNTDISNHAIGAVYQIARWNVAANKRLNIPISYGYFNAGVLLVNLRYWRSIDSKSLFLSYIENNHKSIVYHDQDVLNAVFYDKTSRLSCRWNMLTYYFWKVYLTINDEDESGNVLRDHIDYKQELPMIVRDPAVIHYVSRPKPWELKCLHPWYKEYLNYRKMAGFKIEHQRIQILKEKIVGILSPIIYRKYI